MNKYHQQVEVDGDEVVTPMPIHCLNWACADSTGKPELRNEGGYMRCPVCGASYGKVQRPKAGAP